MTYEQFEQRYRDDSKVEKWLRENPPPAEWIDTRLAWAYLEMPFWSFW